MERKDEEEGRKPHGRRPSGEAPRHAATRREFLRLSALGLAGVAATAAGARAAAVSSGVAARSGLRLGRGNAMPGRIVLSRDPSLNGQGTIDAARVEAVVHQGVRILTGIPNTAAAFESLFPGLHAGSRIAIKVNCIGYTDTRWETARGVVSGLALMLGGSYDVGQVTIYDNRNFVNRPSNPYRASDFTFNGHCPVIDNSIDDCSAYYVYDDHRLCQYLIDADYVINMPVLKSHDRPIHQLTLAFKNHYGSCCPSDLCNDTTGMLTLNADPNVRDKTALVLMDALRGTYDGPPQQAPQVWETFPEGTPNLLFLSTDPVTNEYWGREIINAERIARSLEPKPAPWIELAAQQPYSLGIAEEAQMTVLRHDPAAAPEEAGATARRASGAWLLSVTPNPSRSRATLHFRLAAPARARLTILDAAGRVTRDLGERAYDRGPASLIWDGRDGRGASVSAGIYLARIESALGSDLCRLVRTP